MSELKNLGVVFTDINDGGWKEQLTFKTLRSLELEVGHSMNCG